MAENGVPGTFNLMWVADGFDWNRILPQPLECHWAIGQVHVHLPDLPLWVFSVSHN